MASRADATIGELGRLQGGAVDLEAGPALTVSDREVSPVTPEPQPGDPDAIRSLVRRKAGQIQACYERRLKLLPRLGGRVEVFWSYENGAVDHAELVDNGTGDAELGSCILRRVRAWRVPAELGSGEVITPWVLSPG